MLAVDTGGLVVVEGVCGAALVEPGAFFMVSQFLMP
jgi:hypothetical protein